MAIARSTRIAKITSRTIHAIQIPHKARAAGPLRVGVYCVFGSARPHDDIGEVEDCYERLLQQNQSKDFWTMAVGITSKTSVFDKARVRCLEWCFLEQAERVGCYRLENAATPGGPCLADRGVLCRDRNGIGRVRCLPQRTTLGISHGPMACSAGGGIGVRKIS